MAKVWTFVPNGFSYEWLGFHSFQALFPQNQPNYTMSLPDFLSWTCRADGHERSLINLALQWQSDSQMNVITISHHISCILLPCSDNIVIYITTSRFGACVWNYANTLSRGLVLLAMFVDMRSIYYKPAPLRHQCFPEPTLHVNHWCKFIEHPDKVSFFTTITGNKAIVDAF